MIDKKKFIEKLDIENFKIYILELERDNLRSIEKDDNKSMVNMIIKAYEGAEKDDNK